MSCAVITRGELFHKLRSFAIESSLEVPDLKPPSHGPQALWNNSRPVCELFLQKPPLALLMLGHDNFQPGSH